MLLKSFNSRAKDFYELALNHPEDEFFIVTALPGSFLLDVKSNEISEKAKGVQYILFTEDELKDVSFCAERIKNLNPDVALACSFWTAPFDWLGIRDSLVAEELRNSGIKVICHSTQTQETFFDKRKAHEVLEQKGFNVPKAVYVHRDLYWSERGKKEVRNNVYKELVLSQVKKLKFPVVIKDTVGLSSYGMEVARTYKEAVHYLNMGRTTCDRIVEEYIEGFQFGAEVYGTKNNYSLMPAMMFSVNRFGITSPKQGIKIGPFTVKEYESLGATDAYKDLHDVLKTLAEEFKFCGIAQVDLILKDDKWYVIEVNTRLSGMTETYAAMTGISCAELLYRVAIGYNFDAESILEKEHPLAANFKIPLLKEDMFLELKKIKGVVHINQIQNLAAKQEREKGYCEIILRTKNTCAEAGFKPLTDILKELCKIFPEIDTPEMWEHLKNMGCCKLLGIFTEL